MNFPRTALRERGEGIALALAASLLRPACGEKVAGRPDEGPATANPSFRTLERDDETCVGFPPASRVNPFESITFMILGLS
jgi:hypothetical protein